MLLLYADDPGAANYLAPLPAALAPAGYQAHFLVDPALAGFARDRSIACDVRDESRSPEALLAGARLLVIGTSENPDSFGHRLTAAARTLRIPSIAVVDQAVNAAWRFKGRSTDPLFHVPDWLIVADDASRATYAALGFPNERIFVCGHPHFDRVRQVGAELAAIPRSEQRRRAYPDAPPDRPIWMFASEGIDQLNRAASFQSPGYTLHGRGDTSFRSAIVLEEILDAAAGMTPTPWVVLRLHPKNQLSDFDTSAGGVDSISSGGDPLPLAWSADLVLGMSSMLLLEACLLGRPHLSILPKEDERAWLPPLLETGVTTVVTTRAALREALTVVAPPRPKRIADLFPAGSTERVVRVVDTCIGSGAGVSRSERHAG